MFRGKKIFAVMLAYNAARTLRQTYDEVMAQEVVDTVVIVDDASQDETTTSPRSCRTLASKRIPRISATGKTRRRATAWPSSSAPTSSSWCIPTASTRPS